MLLLTEPNSLLSELIVARVRALGNRVRVLVTADDDLPAWMIGKVEACHVVPGDTDALRRAHIGVSGVVTCLEPVPPAQLDHRSALRAFRRLLEVSQAARVDRFMMISALGAQRESPCATLRWSASAELALRASDLPYTILAPALVMEHWIPTVVGEPALAHRSAPIIGDGRTRHPFVSAMDVAAYAVAALHHPAARDQRLPLGGPDALSWRDVIRTYEWLLGRSISVTAATHDVPGLCSESIALLTAYDSTEPTVVMDDLSQIYGIRGTPLDVIARHHLASSPLASRRG